VEFINEHGVDVYAIFNEIHDILGYPPYEPTNTTHMGVGIYGLIADVINVLPLDDFKALIHKKMDTRKYIKTLVTVLKSPEFVVSIHCFYLNFVSCCLCYVQTSV
jgi:hypothetical protein